MIFGDKECSYRADHLWNEKVKELGFQTVTNVSVDSKDRLYVLTRQAPFVSVLSQNGELLEQWGEDQFLLPHDMCVDPEGRIYCVDSGAHAVYLLDHKHQVLDVYGEKGCPSDSGCVNKDYRTILRGAPPFHYPTGVSLAENGDVYFSDGYGNARVHVFSRQGVWRKSWGSPGDGKGEFRLPHGIRVFQDRVYVADRENHRIQIFDLEGNYLEEWNGFCRPAGIFLDSAGNAYVSESKRASDFDEAPSRVTILNSAGKIKARLENPLSAGYLPERGHHTAHSICVDSSGNIYIGEVGQKFPRGYCGLKRFCPVDGHSA
ncbi:6-bladed beta-propeller [Hominifimenecus sp. rT4P-3]|uniref:6-bladed beta-propeller n=1 Tax=Hominifimenecus sp. rT4P-3 TaxID=3242979 RepID=UPI003DA2DE6C